MDVVTMGLPSSWTIIERMLLSGMRSPTVLRELSKMRGIFLLAGKTNVKGPGVFLLSILNTLALSGIVYSERSARLSQIKEKRDLESLMPLKSASLSKAFLLNILHPRAYTLSVG